MVVVNDQEEVMELLEYRNIFDHEESHFFYVSTHYLVTELVKKYLPHPSPLLRKERVKILDAGCGTGGLMKKLSKIGKVVGFDYSFEAVKLGRKREVVVKLASILKIPFKNNAFGAVTCIDVLYHRAVANDVAVLKEVKRVLKTGGILILRVPANKFLMSAHDKYVHTARRYSKGELERKIRKAGLIIKQISYIHSPIMPISLVKIFLEKLLKKGSVSSVGSVNPLVNWFFTWLLCFEARLVVAGLWIPFGQGLVVVATK